MEEDLIEAVYFAIDEITKSFVSDKVRIRFKKDFYPAFLSQLSKKNVMTWANVSERSVYTLLKKLTILMEDPEKPRTFVLYKSEWEKFFKNYLEEKHK
jgi:hypothetical protein